jgi:hypothetical protein
MGSYMYSTEERNPIFSRFLSRNAIFCTSLFTYVCMNVYMHVSMYLIIYIYKPTYNVSSHSFPEDSVTKLQNAPIFFSPCVFVGLSTQNKNRFDRFRQNLVPGT